jgi:FixJ family two-component response regulator
MVEHRELTVVVIDDDFRVGESVGSLVESAGYIPRVFLSAEEFLESGALGQAGCIITDVRMPGMDGLELQRRLRAERPALPVIFITAHFDDEARRRAFEGGALEFLYKPFNAADLMHAIDRASDRSPDHRI